MNWLLPVALGIVLPITALLDAACIPSTRFALAGRSKSSTITWLILIPALAPAYWWISGRWIVVGAAADRLAGSTEPARHRFGPMVARSTIASVVVALLWSAQNDMSPGAVLVMSAVLVIPVYLCVLIVDVGGALLGAEQARNVRAGEQRDRWA